MKTNVGPDKRVFDPNIRNRSTPLVHMLNLGHVTNSTPSPALPLLGTQNYYDI